MSTLYDYFLATSDEQAVKTIDWIGGPGKPNEGDPLPLLADTGVEPIAQMGMLESKLTGASFESVLPNYVVIAHRDDGERLVIRLSEDLQAAIAKADETKLREIAHPWSEIEEFWGQGDSGYLGEFLVKLAAMTKQGAAQDQRIYCWVSV